MKLSELKNEVDKALDKYGDMEVAVLLHRTENCSECRQPVDRNCSSAEVFAGCMGNDKGRHRFWIDGEVE